MSEEHTTKLRKLRDLLGSHVHWPLDANEPPWLEIITLHRLFRWKLGMKVDAGQYGQRILRGDEAILKGCQGLADNPANMGFVMEMFVPEDGTRSYHITITDDGKSPSSLVSLCEALVMDLPLSEFRTTRRLYVDGAPSERHKPDW